MFDLHKSHKNEENPDADKAQGAGGHPEQGVNEPEGKGVKDPGLPQTSDPFLDMGAAGATQVLSQGAPGSRPGGRPGELHEPDPEGLQEPKSVGPHEPVVGDVLERGGKGQAPVPAPGASKVAPAFPSGPPAAAVPKSGPSASAAAPKEAPGSPPEAAPAHPATSGSLPSIHETPPTLPSATMAGLKEPGSGQLAPAPPGGRGAAVVEGAAGGSGPGAASAWGPGSTGAAPARLKSPSQSQAGAPRPSYPAGHLPEGLKLLERLVHLAHERNATDVHLLEGERPRVRLRGDLLPLEAKDHPVVTRGDIQDILNYALTPEQLETFDRTHDIDFSLDFRDAMGRVNVGMANGRRLHFVLRYLPSNLIPLDDLGIDAGMLKRLIASESGLVIVSGETSSGKTTTIIAMLDYINHTRFGAITTIENPIEYVLRSDKCQITRREVGRDTPDFHTALRASVRKNPDVLLIGEIRDHETGSIALSAAETGIQTFCTLHSVGAIPAITRLGYIMVGGGHDEGEFFNRLANVLRGIVAQQLVKAVDGKTVLPVYEILNITYSEKTYLRERDFPRLEGSLETERNISLGDCVYGLWHREPRPINEEVIRRVFGDQYNLAMNRLQDKGGWKPLVTAMG